ncbi:GFA family protein [Pseudomonas sp. DOAB1067]|uniref:GFA family protein n=2 Tax=Pseudomonas triticifolii TaxID=2762592 RepID=A0ABR7BM73_9PSED|nr:GFA family protein [Pseudomonas triticifolii]
MQTNAKDGLLAGSCHCGNVRVLIPHLPAHAIKCNCSICLRLGAVWAQYEAGAVTFEGHPQNTSSYVWGQKTLRTIRCKNCGCVTHWEAILPEPGVGVGVNINNFDRELIGMTPVRHFDGADSWAYLE